MKNFKDRDMQLLLGQVLRAGTVISVSVVFLGGIIYLFNHGDTVANYRVFIGIPGFIRHFNDLIYNSYILKGQAVIQLGIILLIATPVLRVIFSTIGFVLEKDYMYVVISLLVLSIIFLSMLSGHAG